MTARDRIRGCLLGGAVGDALGAPVEFLSRGEILARYGPGGIREMDEAYGVRGAITDDTQMTLFTAEGLIEAHRRGELRGICNPLASVAFAYDRWLVTQGETTSGETEGLIGIEALHRRRAPGLTCLSALHTAAERKPGDDIVAARNDSKGCGAVMRVAPVGLLSARPYRLACDAGLLTHGHPLGWTSAGVFAVLIASLVRVGDLRETVQTFVRAPHEFARDGLTLLPDTDRTREAEALDELGRLLAWAVTLAENDQPPDEAISQLGEGWVAEEALAIAVFCALRFPGDFEAGVVAAVNHAGDSDSTGSMTGQLLGVALGEAAIPARWLDALELRNLIARVADDLASCNG